MEKYAYQGDREIKYKTIRELKKGDKVYVSYEGYFSYSNFVEETVKKVEHHEDGINIELDKIKINVGLFELGYREFEEFKYSGWNCLFSKELLEEVKNRMKIQIEKYTEDIKHIEDLLT